uniref:Uncharacterized protein n=1 Tax=Phenylobacterium glaciei TaxID=2803784 RepID=A0A974S7A8_9CAUL|nr:hypothetical protein JKL49_16595 [Phenylobacterium glaciei]
MLVEVLALLVFMAMAFAFVMREEGDRTNPWKEKADKLEQQVQALERVNRTLTTQIAALKRQISQLEDSIRLLVAEHDGTLPPNGYVTIPGHPLQRRPAKLRTYKPFSTRRGATMPGCGLNWPP